MPETTPLLEMPEDERHEYIEWGVATLVRRGHDSPEAAELEQWAVHMRAALAALMGLLEQGRAILSNGSIVKMQADLVGQVVFGDWSAKVDALLPPAAEVEP